MDAWFGAWNEDDADARDALIHECCSEDVEFRVITSYSIHYTKLYDP